jgi:hypothetical protein
MAFVLQRAHHLLVEPDHEARAAVRDEPHFAGLTWLEPHGRSGWNVEAKSNRCVPIEFQRRVCLGEMKVTTNLNRSIAGVRDCEHNGCSVPIQRDVAGGWKNLAGRHVSATIANAPPNAAMAPIVRNATLPIERPLRQQIPMPTA